MNRDNVKTGPWQRSTKPEEFNYLSVGEWQGKPVPARKWVVDGLIPVGQVALISGDGGKGKSQLAQQLLTAGALGDKWLGFRVEKMRTFGMFCEDGEAELQIRQAAINRYYECDMADLGEDMYLQSRLNQLSYMATFDRFTDEMRPTLVWDQLQTAVYDIGAQIIVLDTARKTFGGNEINERQVAHFVQMLRKLAIAMQGCIILTSHPSNEGIASGSGLGGSRAWHNDVRSRLYLTDPKVRAGQEPDPAARVLHTMKNNYGPNGGKIDLHYRRGVFVVKSEPAAPLRDYSEPDPLL